MSHIPFNPPKPKPTYTEKACKICGVVKPLEDFAKSNRHRDGRGSYCKPCAKERYQAPARERNSAIEPTDPTEPRTCRECQQVKPSSEFYWRRDSATYRDACIECKRGHSILYYQNKGLDRQRAWRLRKFGITQSDYDRMWAEQGGVCAICYGRCQVHGELLSVDHDHETGQVRKLLCGHCNKGLGLFRDNPDFLMEAAAYLMQYKDVLRDLMASGQSGGVSDR